MAGSGDAPPVVLGVDIGTTSTKAVAYDTTGRQLASNSVGYPLSEPQPGYAEQDPQRILDAVVTSVRATVAELGRPVAGLSFGTAMHSLIGLD
ncbi:FGGY family carbohydrate kinase, partial [Micromonospora azadirachtae]